MRSPRELGFRLAQELRNLWLLGRAPSTGIQPPTPLAGLPSPVSIFTGLRQTAFAAEVEALAGLALTQRFPIFGEVVDAGNPIAWRRDFRSGAESGLDYFRCVPYLAYERAGDHKLIWELNRHQHLVVLAQAYGISRRREFLDEIGRQMESWNTANPWMRGMNWTSALEVAFRALSWLWVYHLAGDALSGRVRELLTLGLYRHGCYLENNLSYYFAPNTHLLGEAVALHALGALLPDLPRAGRWAKLGRVVVEEQMLRQVNEDGSHFEQSAYYHLYALDMFLFHHILAPGTSQFYDRLSRMAEYLDALIGPSELLPALGDDDGGRFFHPYGARNIFGRATLATCGVVFDRPDWVRDAERLHQQAAWWLGTLSAPAAPRRAGCSRLFPAAGTAILESCNLHAVFDGGPFARGPAGHSHCDSLSIVLQSGGGEILIDPGTYTYVGDGAQRDRFRSTAAHNSVRVDRLEQATAGGPFGWKRKPEVRIERWTCDQGHNAAEALCHYQGITHRRVCCLAGSDGAVLFVVDQIEGGAGAHLVEQFWHCAGRIEQESATVFTVDGRARLLVGGSPEIQLEEGCEYGWRSTVFGQKQPSPVLRVSAQTVLPAIFVTVIDARLTGELPQIRVSAVNKCVYRLGSSEIMFNWEALSWTSGV